MLPSTLCLSGLGMTLQKPGRLQEPSVDDEKGFSLKVLDSEDMLFKEIVVDFENAGLKVLKVERLSNRNLWQRYVAEKKTVLERKPQDPNFKLNEKYLYHGTTAQKEYICNEGLDARLSKKGRFGRGIYFSDYPKKCVTYAEKGKKESLILLERVILGEVKVYPDGVKNKKLGREPEKESPVKGWRFYDSVKGRPKDYREYVVYNSSRALVECIITYYREEKLEDRTPSLTSTKKPANYARTANLSEAMDDTSSDTDSGSEDSNSNSDTTDGEEGSSDSDTDQEEDSSDRFKDDKNQKNSKGKENFVNTALVPTVISGKDILAQKKREFKRRTGESKVQVIESFLCSSGLDVDVAVQLYQDKGEKKKELLEKKKRANTDTEVKLEEDSKELIAWRNAQASTVDPSTNPERWKQLSEEDQAAIIDGLAEDFLTVVGLENDDTNRRLSHKILCRCDYDLDLSISAYYESL